MKRYKDHSWYCERCGRKQKWYKHRGCVSVSQVIGSWNVEYTLRKKYKLCKECSEIAFNKVNNFIKELELRGERKE